MLSAILILLAGTMAGAENVDPTGDGSQYAWGEHIGWLNAEPQGDGGPGVLVNDLELTGWIWSGDFGWISLSCQNTSNCGTNDYGVVNDGKGNLSGFAWGEHIGWINFRTSGSSDCCIANGTPGCTERACEAVICNADAFCCYNNWDQFCADAAAAQATCSSSCAGDPSGVRIDGLTGVFSGWAWAENEGWIKFGIAPEPESYQIETAWRCPDPDADSVCTASDGCPVDANLDQSDADADTIGDICDNCPNWANPAQATVLFGLAVLATNKTDFEWPMAVEWQMATGAFVISADIGTYVEDFFVVGSGTIHTDPIFPDAGTGYWYIFRPNCPAGSYATGTATEQGDRDGALIP